MKSTRFTRARQFLRAVRVRNKKPILSSHCMFCGEIFTDYNAQNLHTIAEHRIELEELIASIK